MLETLYIRLDRLFPCTFIASRAIVADRVTLLPGTAVDKQAVMGSGALSRRSGYYVPLSVRMCSKKGEAVSSGTCQPLGREGNIVTLFGCAFYKRKAPYIVISYQLIVLVNAFMSVLTAASLGYTDSRYHSDLNRCRITWEHEATALFNDHWYRPALVYAMFAF